MRADMSEIKTDTSQFSLNSQLPKSKKGAREAPFLRGLRPFSLPVELAEASSERDPRESPEIRQLLMRRFRRTPPPKSKEFLKDRYLVASSSR